MNMNSNLRSFFLRRYTVGIALLIIASCDVFEQDALQPEDQVVTGQTEYYILPGTSTVIDLKSVVTASYISAKLKIEQSPTLGELNEIDALLLKYRPSEEFKRGRDQFIVSIESNGKIVGTETITITMKERLEEFPCALFAVQDKARVSSGSSVSVNILDNDRLCGIITDDLQVSIQVSPRFGEAELVGGSTIVYTAGSEYTGQDELTYRIEDSSGEFVSYGILSVIDDWTIEIIDLPPNTRSLSFIDEQKGLIGGFKDIYRTVDGGVTWEKSLIRGVEDEYEISDVDFVDSNTGFATFLHRRGTDNRHVSGLLKSVDGGVTWDVITVFDNVINMACFSNSSTGLVGVYEQDVPMSIKMLKTEDEGRTWREVFASDWNAMFAWGYRSGLRFANSMTGYFLLDERVNNWVNGPYHNKIYKTNDRGETWEPFYASGGLRTFSYVPDGIICAIDEFGSKVVRYSEGVPWQTTLQVSLPDRYLYVMEFSHSGNVGFVFGYDRNVDVPIIYRSSDKGITWNLEESIGPVPISDGSLSIPSDDVAYFLCYRDNGKDSFIAKYSRR